MRVQASNALLAEQSAALDLEQLRREQPPQVSQRWSSGVVEYGSGSEQGRRVLSFAILETLYFLTCHLPPQGVLVAVRVRPMGTVAREHGQEAVVEMEDKVPLGCTRL